MYGKKGKFGFFTKGVFFLIMATVFVFVLGSLVMFLWNTLLPDIIGVKEITFWQAVGLFVLSRILFGGFRMGGSRHKGKWKNKKAFWKEKMTGMDDGEKERLKAKWKSYCDKKE
ncbi:MAG: hypothetical protein ACI85O_002719 [Saprospiraceae bacterium]|jgi:hypothetical protein